MNIRLLFLAALCWPMHAMSDNFPTFVSEIPGVQLWYLYADGKTFPYEKFPDDDNEFIQYCNGTRSIYVTELESPIQCQSQVDADGFYRIYLKTTGRRFSRLAVVSTRLLPDRVKSLPITMEESEILRKAEEGPTASYAKEAKHHYLNMYTDASAVGYAMYLREIEAKPTYRKHSGARFKVSSPNGFIYVSAIGLAPDPIGWNIKNVVFREFDGRLEEIGAFEGCIQGFRDLNADGTPEVLTTTCENDEGRSDDFWSLTPTVRNVVTR